MLRRILLLMTMLTLAAAAFACGGDDDDDGEATPTGAASAASPTAGATVGARPTPDVEGVVDHQKGTPWTEAEATALLDAILLKPADLAPGVWTVMSDSTATNADAAQADPTTAASNERCGRLLARTLTNQPEDITVAFIGGETLSYFSTATVYATEAGADDCSAEAATRLAQPGELARAFGSIFIDPDAVQVALADFPPVAEGQFSATLTGQIDAQGLVLDLTILIVAFQSENVTAVVGSARSGSVPPADELAPYAELVLARLQANQ
jgi:hypothetical protein